MSSSQPVSSSQPQEACIPKPVVTGGAIVGGLIGIACIVTALYLGNSAVHNFMNHAFSQTCNFMSHAYSQTADFMKHTFTHVKSDLMNVHWTGQQSLLRITLPVAGAAGVVGLGLLVLRKQRNNKKTYGKNLEDEYHSLSYALKQMKPTRKQVLITLAVLAVLAIAVGGSLAAYHYMPGVQNWANQQPPLQMMQQLLQHKFQLWQSIAYFGGGAAATALAVGGVAALSLFIKDQCEAAEYAVIYEPINLKE